MPHKMRNALNWRSGDCSASLTETTTTTTTCGDCNCACQRLSLNEAHLGEAFSYTHTSSTFLSPCLVLHALLLLLLALSSTLAAPQSCTTCDKNELQTQASENSVEKFRFDHQVTRQDAINALRIFNETYAAQLTSSCNSIKCTDTVYKYCLGQKFINDHCWCEMQHTEGRHISGASALSMPKMLLLLCAILGALLRWNWTMMM
ncbi:uncharacterized protein LOC115624842 isoform X2 [Scaptodrosophila lebanonensis]|uniref:Uncharacterized protein LOC115624842 isoform X2 n=1 Tax=Drosophila lebanonensis TaxID=7225 RepID=A0A6J2THQ8_DROLE|nr:uncharacterized protein LOC115624842 isoform X2 [Scaptodrosophila lebanonensis]